MSARVAVHAASGAKRCIGAARRTSGDAACSWDGIKKGQTCALESFLVEHAPHSTTEQPVSLRVPWLSICNLATAKVHRLYSGLHGAPRLSTAAVTASQAAFLAATINPAALTSVNGPQFPYLALARGWSTVR